MSRQRLGVRPGDREHLPERLVVRLGDGVDHGHQALLGHRAHVAQDPLTVERHPLEAGVEAESDQPEIQEELESQEEDTLGDKQEILKEHEVLGA